jgi:hypothetical protein
MIENLNPRKIHNKGQETNNKECTEAIIQDRSVPVCELPVTPKQKELSLQTNGKATILLSNDTQ